MKRIHLLVLKSYIGPLVSTFFVALFLLVMQFLWKYIDEFVGKGISVGVFAELLFYAAVTFVPMALPLAILLSSIMTFGNMGEFYELTALKSSGISLIRIMAPLIVVSLIISGCAFFIANNLMPYSNLKFKSLLFDVRQKRPEINLREGRFYSEIEDFSIRVGKKNIKTKMLYDLMIYDHRSRNGNTTVVVADSGKMNITADTNSVILDLWSGNSYDEITETQDNQDPRITRPHQHSIFGMQTLRIPVSGFKFERTEEDLFKENYEMLNLSQISYTVDSLQGEIERTKKDFAAELVFLYFRQNPTADSLRKINKAPPLQLFNSDSMLNTFDRNSRFPVYAKAADFARGIQNRVIIHKEDVQNRTKWIRRFMIEWNQKIALSIACFILFFIGAPLGAIIRKGGFGTPVVISVLFFIFYYIISITGEKFAREGVTEPWQGVWISSAVLLPIGIFLTYKAANDSALLDIDTYLNYFRKAGTIFGSGKNSKAKDENTSVNK